MNTNPQLDRYQLDLHPDAESLSAFAEHQLPEHERQLILAHLATCARCRQILFLAQDSIEDEKPATAGGVLLFPAKEPTTKWRYAWGALAAGVALATISIFLYPRHQAIAPEQAKVVPPNHIPTLPVAAPPREGKMQPSQAERLQSSASAASGVRPAPKPEASLGTVTSGVVSANPTAQPAPTQQQAAAASSTTLNITLKPAQSSQTVEVQAAAPPLSQSETATVNVAADQAQLQPATPPVTETMNAQVVQPTDQIKLKGRNVQPLTAAKAAPKAAVAKGGTGNGIGGGVRGGAVGGPVSANGALARSPASFAKMAPRPLTVTPEDEAAARNTLGKTLPSGLPAIATAAASHHLLAVDAAGSVFLSEDAGAVWEPVSAQWTGKAVLVLPPQTAPDQSGGLAIAGRATTDAPSQAAAPRSALFEIVTDQGIHWTSSDGRVWRAK